MFLCELEALLPSSLLGEDFKTREITSFDNLSNLVACNVGVFLSLVDLLDIDLLHLHWSDLLSTVHGSVPLLDLHESFDSLIIEGN